MAKNQKKYTMEFKKQIVDLYNTGVYCKIKMQKVADPKCR